MPFDPCRLISERTAPIAAFSENSRTFGRAPLNLPLAWARASRPIPMAGSNSRDFASARPKASNLDRLILGLLPPNRARYTPTFVRSKRVARKLALSLTKNSPRRRVRGMAGFLGISRT